MNERLKELALQAGFETLPGKLKVSFGDNEPTTSYWEYPHEKFAQLVVLECIDIFSKDLPDPSSPDYKFSSLEEVVNRVCEVAKHFKVD